MTRMLVEVRTTAEAEAAIAGGADRIVVKHRIAADLTSAALGRCPVSLWVDRADPAEAGCDCSEAVDEIYGPVAVLTTPVAGASRVALLPASEENPEEVFESLSRDGFAGVAIGEDAGPQRLLQHVTPARLQQQIDAAWRHGLSVVIAGPLEPPDIPRLLALAPDAILLGAVARRDGLADAPLDPVRLDLLRDLIPRRGGDGPVDMAIVGRDRIFVRDWTVAIPVGAYSHENAAQQVRFTVEAEIAPRDGRAADLRDIVSYDLITDAIGRATARHVDLVETLAEDVARAVLEHPRVVGIDISVEKLEIGPGRVGCRIRRSRSVGA